MAILTLEDLKKVDIFVQNSFFKHFEMYRHTMTVKDSMNLSTDRAFTFSKPILPDINEGQAVSFKTLPELGEYFSPEEQEAM